ncbi:ATP synthase F1 subunit delta [Candidatus Babeliales bacterium]|nr:ATP synthase F1 subunit delta [Candidatus Babeliales bacterium]
MIVFSQGSKAYSKAFIRFFYTSKDKAVPYELYKQWKEDLPQYKKHLLFLAMGSTTKKTKEAIIDEMLALYNFETDAEKKLLLLLCEKRNIELLPEIISYLCAWYQTLEGVEEWTITSAQSLTNADKKKIVSSLEQKTKKTVLPIFSIDEKLYAGFTMRHSKYYWDYSLRSFLKKITYFAHNQE